MMRAASLMMCVLLVALIAAGCKAQPKMALAGRTVTRK